MIEGILTAVIVAAWAVLLLGWGGFWRADQRLDAAPPLARWPEVVVVIPARDEVATIAEVVEAHWEQAYTGYMWVTVADDNSSDGTGDAARAASANVVTVPPLPAGWSGKLWALEAGLRQADTIVPTAEWVMLTDADILHAPGTLGALVAKAEAENLDLVSLMARLDARGFWGRLLIPAFVFFFQKLYPFPWVNRPGHWCAAAAGGCVLIRRSVLNEIGGISALKDALIDDCTLGALVKRGPPARAIWLGLANTEVTSLRDNRALGSIWTMVARTAFTQLRHSWILLVGSVLGMALLYLGPWALLGWGLGTGSGGAIAGGAVAITAMAVAYRPTVALYGLAWPWAFALPVAAVFYAAMTIGSGLAHARGEGGRWKGRTYP